MLNRKKLDSFPLRRAIDALMVRLVLAEVFGLFREWCIWRGFKTIQFYFTIAIKLEQGVVGIFLRYLPDESYFKNVNFLYYSLAASLSSDSGSSVYNMLYYIYIWTE